MTTEISIIVGGKTYNMNNASPFFVVDWDGLGMMPIKRRAQQGPLQHGETDFGFQGQARIFEMTFGIVSDGTLANLIANQRTLLRRLAPRDDLLSILFNFDGAKYQIDAAPLSVASGVSGDHVYGLKRVPVRFKAPDATFYDPALKLLNFNLGGGSDVFTVPTPVPTPVGASSIDATQVINYAGDVVSYPRLIRIYGPVTDPVIYNNTTGEKLDFTGDTIAAGGWYDIDLRYSNKTVTSNSGASEVHKLTDDSDLATFHLEPSPNGDATHSNVIRVVGNNITIATEIRIQYYTRFSGI